jgi:HAD superfamily hydrolase (TIGR01509 family)
MIRTILFDFGNVIAFFDHRRAIEKLRGYTRLEPTELALVLYGGELEIAYENGQISTNRYFEIAKEDGRLNCSLDQFVAAFVDIFTENTGVTALVPRLKKHYRTLLASNTNDAHFTHYRKQFDHVLGHFDGLVVSHEIGARKPHRPFYEHCQKHANCEPGECLFIDDLPGNIHAAEAFGWQGVVLTSPADLIARLKTLGIRGFDDI